MKTRKIPMRKCMGCQEMKNKRELIRVVRTPEGEVVIDKTGKKSGRGAYICPSSDCLEKAITRHSIERALEVSIEENVYQSLREELEAP